MLTYETVPLNWALTVESDSIKFASEMKHKNNHESFNNSNTCNALDLKSDGSWLFKNLTEDTEIRKSNIVNYTLKLDNKQEHTRQ